MIQQEIILEQKIEKKLNSELLNYCQNEKIH